MEDGSEPGGCRCLGTLLLACAPGALLAPGGAAVARRRPRRGRSGRITPA